MTRKSPSPRKAWIETTIARSYSIAPMSPSPRKAWIETVAGASYEVASPSPSPRKAWIETAYNPRGDRTSCVAFPPEGVD